MKQLFLDTETSGTSSYKHGIWQIAGIFLIDGKERGRFNETMQLFPGQQWDEEVTNMFSDRLVDLENFTSPQTVFLEFKYFLEQYIDPFDRSDKALLYGYNVKFDERFLRSFFLNNNNKFFGSWFTTPAIDVMSLAGERLKEVRPQMPNFKLGTVANTLGFSVDPDALHDAMYDTELTYQIYQEITNGQKSK